MSNEYARGRDTGVAVQGATRNNKLEYRLGVFNGNGLTRTTNDNASVQVNGRLMWQPNGNQVLAQRAWVSGALYSEADFESTTARIYALALNFEHNDFHRTTTGNDLKSDIVGIDGVYKYKGVFATGEYYLRRRTPETGAKFRADGGFAQLGRDAQQYRTWEAAFRYGSRDVNEHDRQRHDQGDPGGAQLLLPPAHAEVPDRRRSRGNRPGRGGRLAEGQPSSGCRRSSSSRHGPKPRGRSSVLS